MAEPPLGIVVEGRPRRRRPRAGDGARRRAALHVPRRVIRRRLPARAHGGDACRHTTTTRQDSLPGDA